MQITKDKLIQVTWPAQVEPDCKLCNDTGTYFCVYGVFEKCPCAPKLDQKIKASSNRSWYGAF